DVIVGPFREVVAFPGIVVIAFPIYFVAPTVEDDELDPIIRFNADDLKSVILSVAILGEDVRYFQCVRLHGNRDRSYVAPVAFAILHPVAERRRSGIPWIWLEGYRSIRIDGERTVLRRRYDLNGTWIQRERRSIVVGNDRDHGIFICVADHLVVT